MSRAFLATSPEPSTEDGACAITRIVRRSFAVPTGGSGPDPELAQFLTDLVAPYNLAPYPDPVDATYTAMAEELLGPAGLLTLPVDLVVLAFAVTDADPRPSAAHRLNRLCPGDPLAFAISDQGVAAPFTALALARAYLRTGGCQRALVVVLEQAALPYPAAAPIRLPAQGSAVALVLEPDGGRPVWTVEQLAGVAPEQAADVLAARLTTGSVALLSAPLAARWGGGNGVRVAPADQLCTAVWWELADALPTGGAPLVVADYDPESGCLGLLGLGPG